MNCKFLSFQVYDRIKNWEEDAKPSFRFMGVVSCDHHAWHGTTYEDETGARCSCDGFKCSWYSGACKRRNNGRPDICILWEVGFDSRPQVNEMLLSYKCHKREGSTRSSIKFNRALLFNPRKNIHTGPVTLSLFLFFTVQTTWSSQQCIWKMKL